MREVYSMRGDRQRLRAMQAATRTRPDAGLMPAPYAVGTWRWWRSIRRGVLPLVAVEGAVDRVWWGSMGDWPMFSIRGDDGDVSEWTREGDLTLYVPDQRVRLEYVVQDFKPGAVVSGLDGSTRLVVRIELEETPRRSDAIGPGPFPGAYDDLPASATAGQSWRHSRPSSEALRSGTRFFRRPWSEIRGDQYSEWGAATYYFWELDGMVEQQVERYANGVLLAYDRYHVEDHYGFMTSEPLEPRNEWAPFEIDLSTYLEETDGQPLNRM